MATRAGASSSASRRNRRSRRAARRAPAERVPRDAPRRRNRIGRGCGCLAAVKGDAGAHQIVVHRRGPSRMPAELARLAAAFGSLARRRRRSFAAPRSWGALARRRRRDGSSPATSSRSYQSSSRGATASTSAADKPSRFMPLSIWMAAGQLARADLRECGPLLDLVGAVQHGAQIKLAVDRPQCPACSPART